MKKYSWIRLKPALARIVRVVPTPNGRGEVHVMRSITRHHDSGFSEVSSAHTSDAGFATANVSCRRNGAAAKKPSSTGSALNTVADYSRTVCCDETMDVQEQQPPENGSAISARRLR